MTNVRRESTKANNTYVKYRDMGQNRSFEHLLEVLRTENDGKYRVARSSVELWSKKFKWQERIRKWDLEQDEVNKKQQLEEIKNMVKRHSQQSLLLQKKAIERIQDAMPQDLTLKEALDYMKEGVRIERLTRGQPDIIQENQIDANRVTYQDFAAIYEDIRRKRDTRDSEPEEGD